jgi:hypothetical protein
MKNISRKWGKIMKLFLICLVSTNVLLGCISNNKNVVIGEEDLNHSSNKTDDFGDDKLLFKEMVFSQNVFIGDTQLIFYDIPIEYFKSEKGKTIYQQFIDLDRYDFIDIAFSDSNNIFSCRLLLRAKNPLLHKENISIILSNILKREIEVKDMDVIPFEKYVIGILFKIDENMYFPNGNSIGIYGSDDNTFVLYTFDIAEDPIEFILGYK